MEDNQKIFMDWLDTCPVVEHRSIDNVQEDSATWIYTVDFAVVKEEDEEQEIDKHLGCPSYPNCDEAPMGCIVQSGGDVEWYGHRDDETIYTGDAPSTEASFYKKDKVNSATVIDLVIDLLKNGKVQQAIWELEDHRTTVQTEDLDNQAYSEGEGYR
jgi:hypothetical protein